MPPLLGVIIDFFAGQTTKSVLSYPSFTLIEGKQNRERI
jgi:hypothetical protein